MTGASRRRFAAVVRSEPVDLALACLLIATEVDPDLDPDIWLAALDALAATVRVGRATGAAGHAEAMRVALGEQGSYVGFVADQDDLRASLLHEVLRRRRGLPLLLSVVWVEVAHRAGIRAWPIGLPGRVVVGVGDPEGEQVLVDPFLGGRPADPAAFLGRPAMPGELAPTTALDLLARLLLNVRVLTARQDRSLDAVRTRLWAVELCLLLPRHALALRRERGELLTRLGSFVEGAEAIEEYAELVEDVDAEQAEVSRRQARQARAQLN